MRERGRRDIHWREKREEANVIFVIFAEDK